MSEGGEIYHSYRNLSKIGQSPSSIDIHSRFFAFLFMPFGLLALKTFKSCGFKNF